MALSNIKKGVDEFSITVTAKYADVGGENADTQAILLNMHHQVVQQMTSEGQASNAAATRKKLDEAEQGCLSIEA